MLLTYRSDNGVLRVDDIAYFLYLTHTLCSHFAEEYLMGGVEHTAHHLYHAHGGVVAAGRHEDVVLRGEQLFEVEFCRSLAVAPCDADNGGIRQLRDDAFRIVDVVVVHSLFHRLVDKVRKTRHEHTEYLKQRNDCKIQLRTIQENERQGTDRAINERRCHTHTDNARREHQLLLGGLSSHKRNKGSRKKDQCSDIRQEIPKSPYRRIPVEIRPQRDNCRKNTEYKREYHAFPHITRILLRPLGMFTGAVGVELEHVHIMYEI